jgi:hypothetical protein
VRPEIGSSRGSHDRRVACAEAIKRSTACCRRRPILQRVKLAIYCADIGSVPRGRFGWARSDTDEAGIERHRGGTEIIDLVDAVAEDLAAGRPVALGFECPLFVGVPTQPLRLGTARRGEGNRSWSAGAGAGALATGLVEVAWILSELRHRCPGTEAHVDWSRFARAGKGVFLWEAFVSADAKAATHVDDATIAFRTFREALPDPNAANAVGAERPLSLLGGALIWSGWRDDVDLLHTPCVVIKAGPKEEASNAELAVKPTLTDTPANLPTPP